LLANIIQAALRAVRFLSPINQIGWPKLFVLREMCGQNGQMSGRT